MSGASSVPGGSEYRNLYVCTPALAPAPLGAEAQAPFPAPLWEHNPLTSVVLRCTTLIINSVLYAVHEATRGELHARPDPACRCQQRSSWLWLPLKALANYCNPSLAELP